MLTDKERQAGYALTVYGVIALTLIQFKDGLTNNEKLAFLVVGALAVMFALAITKTNRLWAGVAGMSWLAGPWHRLVLAAYPFLIFWLWTFLKSQTARKKIMDARAAAGEYGAPRASSSSGSGRARKGSSEPTVSATGRAIAEPSRRYTPPKRK